MTTITTLEGLQNISLDVAGDYVLGNDIDASATAGWNGGLGFAPIASFTGTFDGAGFTITGLTIARATSSSIGLFGSATGATIQDVTLASVSITGRSSVGALVGSDNGSHISGCISSGTVTGDRYSVGGLIGYETGAAVIISCSSSCAVTGSVTSSYGLTGGFIGYVYADSGSPYISDCVATGAVTCGQYGGGFIGGLDLGGTITRCRAAGNVSTTYRNCGGFAGYIDGAGGGSVSECCATGTVTIETSAYARKWCGGFMGFAASAAVIRDCYARGAVTVVDTASACGGFAGLQDNSILTRCYSTGAVGGTDPGGFVGLDDAGSYTSCWWDTTTSSEADACGSGTVTGVTGYATALTGTEPAGWPVNTWLVVGTCNDGYACLINVNSGCALPTSQASVLGDRTVVIEKPVLELMRNVEVQLDGRIYVSKDGDFTYESRYHRSG